jgi:hypothetical protein
VTGHLCDQTFVQPETPYFKDSQVGVCHFCTLKIDQVVKETGATLYPFFRGSKGVMNKDPGNTKGGSITVLLTSCLTGLD